MAIKGIIDCACSSKPFPKAGEEEKEHIRRILKKNGNSVGETKRKREYMAIQKISRDSISDQVFVQMKEQILEGEWKPGEKIPSENELARQFGVSR